MSGKTCFKVTSIFFTLPPAFIPCPKWMNVLKRWQKMDLDEGEFETTLKFWISKFIEGFALIFVQKLIIHSPVDTNLAMQQVMSTLTNFWKARDSLFYGFPLIERPILVFLLCVSYVIFVKWLGPYLMKDREAFDLKKTMMIYNLSQVIISLYVFAKIFNYFLKGPVDRFSKWLFF